MKIVYGDIIQLAKSKDYDVLIHGCNCFNKMGRGVARIISEHFPRAKEADDLTVVGDIAKLGTISVGYCPDYNLHVVNAYIQYNYGTNRRFAQYEAIESCFQAIRSQFSDKRILYPKIGAGLAGGNWTIIADIIDKQLDGLDHTCAVLPGV